MLKKLTIKNIALIDKAEIEFCEGLNVMSGETGAGKSVILDSINFALGAKADKSMIRYGEQDCYVQAVFSVDENSECLERLKEMDIESDTDVIISRKYDLNGKGDIKINGCSVNSAMLKNVTSCMVDVHGQSEHFFLLKEANQLKVLDRYSLENLEAQKFILAEKIDHYKFLKNKLAEVGLNDVERSRKIDILKFQIDEIKLADIKEGEEQEFLSKRNILRNGEKILTALNFSKEALSNDEGGINFVNMAKRSMLDISGIDDKYKTLTDRIDSCNIELMDIADGIENALDDLDIDPEELERVEQRLEVINSIKKKYSPDLAKIQDFLDKLEQEYDLLINCDEFVEKTTQELFRLKNEIYKICQIITNARKKSAKNFCEKVVLELKSLNISSPSFEVAFNEYNLEDIDKVTKDGMDSVKFMFSANKGEPLKEMSKIISGGEMSRFMLAIKTQLKELNGISTYIFDEIDAGISGITAGIVAQKFASISKQTQIIVVSHLAQISAMADNAYLIEKTEKTDKTVTTIKMLDNDERVNEIVRLIGGTASASSITHAKEMLKDCENYKMTL